MSRIVVAPTTSGSSAATALRNTISESRKQDREREQLGARDVRRHLVADLRRGDTRRRRARRHGASRSRCLDARPRARRSSLREVGEQVGRAAVLGDQPRGRRRARSATTAPTPRTAQRAPPTASIRRCAAGESGRRAEPHERHDARRRARARCASDRAARAGTASACGSSKSSSVPSSPNTGSANAAATSTSTAASATRIARRRRKINPPARPTPSPTRPGHDPQVERGDDVQQHPVGEEVPCLASGSHRPARSRSARAGRSRRARRAGSAGRDATA